MLMRNNVTALQIDRLAGCQYRRARVIEIKLK